MAVVVAVISTSPQIVKSVPYSTYALQSYLCSYFNHIEVDYGLLLYYIYLICKKMNVN